MLGLQSETMAVKETSYTDDSKNDVSNKYHKLHDTWCYWAHLPHNTDWTLKSYKKIYNLDTVEGMITVSETIPDKMIKNCMLFLMRDGIHPTWEDPKNRKGGCFSYKIANKNAPLMWKMVSYNLVGETLSRDKNVSNSINGITISPKKNFCIMKIWLSTCNYQDPTYITNIPGLNSRGCLFKKHNPEY